MPPRFYYTEEITINQAIELPIDARHHATRVLRLRTGDIVTLFNGKGGEFSAQIAHITKSNTTVLINKHYAIERESPLIIELAQAICINEKMDWIIQKSVEVGVTYIQPIITDRSVVRLSNERAFKRLQHWQKIVISACEQCGRNHLPQVLPLISLTDWLHIKNLDDASHNSCFMLSPSATERLKYFPTPPSNTRLTVVVGPEGGFTPEEEKNILRTGFTPLCLGKRILRTESAALATIAAMQTLWGDY
tara:strand:+ start:1343 stop:2089 length:747 start_codon:yes stop_codon:yes gene_type:complete